MEIRKMQTEDIDYVMEIEMASFNLPWTKDQFMYELTENPYANLLVLEEAGKILGFVDFWITFEVCQINQIAVNKAHQNCGLGSKLLKAVFARVLQEEVDLLTLEVRTTNKIAIDFYQKFGFVTQMTKKHYYENGDDAYYMFKRAGEINE